jgi:hypothetical protein
MMFVEQRETESEAYAIYQARFVKIDLRNDRQEGESTRHCTADRSSFGFMPKCWHICPEANGFYLCQTSASQQKPEKKVIPRMLAGVRILLLGF